jgi:hypothetical protein
MSAKPEKSPTSGKWEQQGDLFSVPRARWSNPPTSRQAAQSIPLKKVSLTQQRIIQVFKFNGGQMSDERLVELYHSYWDEGTDQGIRSRRGELTRRGKIFDTGKRGTTKYGRSCIIWRLTS